VLKEALVGTLSPSNKHLSEVPKSFLGRGSRVIYRAIVSASLLLAPPAAKRQIIQAIKRPLTGDRLTWIWIQYAAPPVCTNFRPCYSQSCFSQPIDVADMRHRPLT
jgi:hypothetical protein